MSFMDKVLEMVIHSHIGAQTVAENVGKKYLVLLNELSSKNHKFGADILIHLMKACRTGEPMHSLAASMGGLFIKVSDDNCSNMSLVMDVNRVWISQFAEERVRAS